MNRDNLLYLIYFLSLGVYVISEIVLQRKSPEWKSLKPDWNFIMLLIPYYTCVYLSPLEYALLNYELHETTVIIGFAMFYAGLSIRIAGFQTLGNSFSVSIQAKNDGKLVINGIFRYVRHPLYLAVILFSMSGAFIFSCRIMWVFVLFTLIGILVRIREEEYFLTAKYIEYEEYKRRTKKLVPYIY